MLTYPVVRHRILHMVSGQESYDQSLYMEWAPEKMLSGEQLARLKDVDTMIRQTTGQFSREFGLGIELETRTRRPQPASGMGKDMIPASWDGAMLYNFSIGKTDGGKKFSVEYYLHGNTHTNDARDLGTISTVEPVKVWVPQSVADRTSSLASHQKLPIVDALRYKENLEGNLAVGEVRLYGAATAENMQELLSINIFPLSYDYPLS